MRHSPHTTPRQALVAARLVVIVLVTACGRGLAPASQPETTPVPAPPEVALFAYSLGERHALFESRATVRVEGDTSSVSDTVATRLYASLYITPVATASATATAPTLTGTVDSVTVIAGSRAGAGTTPLAAPISFTGVVVDGGTVRLTIPDSAATACDSPNGAYLAIARDLLPSLPGRLEPGASWSDTVMTTTCRGGVILTTTAAHRYVVQDDTSSLAGRPATRIARTTSYALRGAGTQAGVPVTVAGEGTGDAEIMVDITAGELLKSIAHSSLNISFDAAGRMQRVVQDAAQSVTISR